jgi:hypothetical protein
MPEDIYLRVTDVMTGVTAEIAHPATGPVDAIASFSIDAMATRSIHPDARVSVSGWE